MLSMYPACFFKEESGYSVIFPDLDLTTCGETLDESMVMAVDCLAGLCLQRYRHDSFSILFTGFKGVNNSSCQLINLMQGDKVLLTNSFGGILRDINTLGTSYNRVIMFGLDKTLKDEIRLEKAAKQERDIVYSTMDLSEYIEAAKRNGLLYTMSDKPTEYLCNYAYYCMMKKMRCPVLFVHIPTAKNMSEGFMQKVVNVFSE